jgi:hypothetical protein
MARKSSDDRFSEEETARRFETALRAGLNMPAKPHSEMKLGKPKNKRRKTKAKRRR